MVGTDIRSVELWIGGHDGNGRTKDQEDTQNKSMRRQLLASLESNTTTSRAQQFPET